MAHVFKSIWIDRKGRQRPIGTFRVADYRDAEAAYQAAEARCDLARDEGNAAYVHEILDVRRVS